MNPTLQLLFEIASKDSKNIVGLMSGTSLDGLDIVHCRLSGTGAETRLELLNFKTAPYPPDLKEKLRALVCVPEIDTEELCLTNRWLADYHADLLLKKLRDWGVEAADIDLIASHGQTVYHAPRGRQGRANATLQIGDGDHLARKTGILTVSDFRQKHTAAGGEGAPLVPFADELLFRTGEEDRLLLNIGGMANYTFLPADPSGEIIFADTGPGNTLVNAAVQRHFDRPFDDEGAIASTGTVQPELLKELLAHPYFREPASGSSGPEVFNLEWVLEQQQKAGIEDLSPEDLVATLTWLTAQTIADAVENIDTEGTPAIYVSGGGIHNSRLMKWIDRLLVDSQWRSFEEIGFNPDAKEAVSFTVLANETLSGRGFLMNPRRNVGRRVNLGKISLPV